MAKSTRRGMMRRRSSRCTGSATRCAGAGSSARRSAPLPASASSTSAAGPVLPRRAGRRGGSVWIGGRRRLEPSDARARRPPLRRARSSSSCARETRSSLPVDDASCDAALCVQVLEYVADPTVALAEMHRALRPGGRVVVWDVDWATVSLHALDPALTARVLRGVGRASHPPVTAAHPRAPVAVGRTRGRAHGGAAVRHLELDPETYGAALLPFVSAFVAGRNGDHRRAGSKRGSSEQQQLGEGGEFCFSSAQFQLQASPPCRGDHAVSSPRTSSRR